MASVFERGEERFKSEQGRNADFIKVLDELERCALVYNAPPPGAEDDVAQYPLLNLVRALKARFT